MVFQDSPQLDLRTLPVGFEHQRPISATRPGPCPIKKIPA